MKNKLYTVGLLLSLFMQLPLTAQTIDSSAYKQYTFIRKDLNKVQNDSTSLSNFYAQLAALEQTKSGRLNIVQVGDSHIQADNFSGAIRQKLQLHFGNAGRGLIFPYRVARSNEPTSYRTSTNTLWDNKRNVFLNKPLPIGLCGFTIETTDSLAEIGLMVKDQPGLGYAFTKFTLFHEKGAHQYDLTICDDTNCERGVFLAGQDTIKQPFVSQMHFDSPLRQLILRTKIQDTLHRSTRIYGMLLENDSSGILYNMIGVNGAEYRHYNMSKYFLDQFSYLDPKLVILSMGTNEAYMGGFDKDAFYRNVDTLVSSIRSRNPGAALLITTPGDSYKRTRKGRIKNPDVKVAKETLIQYCLEHNIAYWDLYDIMGGYGSMGKWVAMGIAQRDRVHFTGKGYLIQGDLFYNALMDGFENYKKQHSN